MREGVGTESTAIIQAREGDASWTQLGAVEVERNGWILEK